VFLAMFAFVSFMMNQMVRLLEATAIPDTVVVQLWVGFLVLFSITVTVQIWSVGTCGRFVGAFPRVLRELDGILAGREKRHIGARPGDVLANDVLVRINALIDRMDQAPDMSGDGVRPLEAGEP